MSDPRSGPGCANVEDYYDSDYVPHDLIGRYNDLQREMRKRTANKFEVMLGAHEPAVSNESSGGPAGDESIMLTGYNPFPSASGRAQQVPHKATSRPSSQPPRVGGQPISASRFAPRPSRELDMLFGNRVSTLDSDRVLANSMSHVGTSPSTVISCSSTYRETAPTATSLAVVKHPATQQRRYRESTTVAAPVVSEPYDVAAEVLRQERFLSESKRLGKPFLPSGGGTLDIPTRFMLGDCVKALYRSIAPHWRIASPTVVSTAEDLIAVYFSLEKLSKEDVTVLLQYMNAALKHDRAISEFRLSKVTEGWDVLTEDGYVLYTFRPPWVRKRVFLPDTVTPPYAHV